jgi:hypothetical protein
VVSRVSVPDKLGCPLMNHPSAHFYDMPMRHLSFKAQVFDVIS